MTEQTNIHFWKSVMKSCPQSYKDLFTSERSYLGEHITENSRVLEVGCGDGRSLIDVLVKTKNIYGVDHDATAVADARKNLSYAPEVSILMGDGRSLPFRDGFFDYVTCMTTPANFGDDRSLFYGEMKRVLKNDGEIIMSVFNEDAFEDRMKTYLGSDCDIKKTRGTTVIFNESFGANTSEQFSREQLEEIFAYEGLKPREIVKAGVGYICRLGKD